MKDDNTIVGKFSTLPSNFDMGAESMSIYDMKTSTPVKTNPLKIIVLKKVSHLKIYEEYEDIEPFFTTTITMRRGEILMILIFLI